MGRAIIVTGTPGTGKTTFSTRLAKAIAARYLSLTDFAAQHRLYSGFDQKRRSKIIDLAKTRTALGKMFSKTEGIVVIDSHVPDGIVPREFVRRVFVLRCHPTVLEARLRAKRWRAKKIRENVLAEILDSCLSAATDYLGSRKVVELDTSGASVRECVASAQRILRGKSPKRRVRIDWLATLEDEGRLQRYLK